MHGWSGNAESVIQRARTELPVQKTDDDVGELAQAATHVSDALAELIQGINDEGKTILIVTHEDDIAHMTKRIVNLKDGIIIDDSVVTQVRAKSEAYV